MTGATTTDRAGRPASGDSAPTMVHLFGGPRISVGTDDLHVPPGSQRLVCFVALRRGPYERSFVAGTLWPDGDDARAARNLRSSLFRLHQAGVFIVEADKWRLRLTEGVHVDVDELVAWADRAINAVPDARVEFPPDLPHDVFELLPAFDDPWVVAERERLRQRVLHALEATARQFLAHDRFADAIDAVLPAVAHEPLRETAQAILVDAYLGQGNIAKARSTFEDFVDLLRHELGMNPSTHMTSQVVRALGPTTIRGRSVKVAARTRPRPR